MPQLNPDAYLRTDIEQPTIREPYERGFFSGLKGLADLFTGTSVMEPDLVSEITAERGTPIDYSNIGSITGGRLRQFFVEPVKAAGTAIHKGMTGKRLSIKDLLAITELNMEVAGGGLSGRIAAAKLAKKGIDPNTIHSFPAWHGSSHHIRHGVFKDSAIGSGEGVQAFGWGHYLTDLKEIAKYYMGLGGRVVTPTYKGKKLELSDKPEEPIDYLTDYIVEMGESVNKTELKTELLGFREDMLLDIEDMKSGLPSNWGFDQTDFVENYDKYPEEMVKLIDEMVENDFKDFEFPEIPREHLYKTIVHRGKDPSEYTYMDWHRPIGGEEIETVKKLKKLGVYEDTKIIKKLKTSGIYDELSDYLAYYQPSKTVEELHGKEVYEIIGRIRTKDTGDSLDFRTPEVTEQEQIAATAALLKSDIQGNVYDAGTLSGGARPGVKNYVVFDPEDIYVREHYIDNELQGIKTYHGTTADIPDHLKDEYINTGEGAQAFSRGHYSAESRDIGQKGYADVLARLKGGDAKANLYQTTLHKGQAPEEFKHLYLDWDKKISEQDPKTQKLLKKTEGYGFLVDEAESYFGLEQPIDEYTVENIFDILRDVLEIPDKEVTDLFLEEGIRGIKYDSATPGMKNYVSYDPKDVTLEDKWTDGVYQHRFDPRNK